MRAETNSDWAARNSDEIVLEISELADRLLNGKPAIDELHVLFAPTGDIQEHSIAGGWGPEFLKLAERFDDAIARIENT